MEEEQLQRLIFFLKRSEQVASVPTEESIFWICVGEKQGSERDIDQIYIFLSCLYLILQIIGLINLRSFQGVKQLLGFFCSRFRLQHPCSSNVDVSQNRLATKSLVCLYFIHYNISHPMSTQKIRELSNTLSLTSRTRPSKNWLNTRSKIHSERQNSRRRYENLTNHSLDGQKAIVNHAKTARRAQWKHDYYKISNTFNPFDKHDFQPFPHNNQKYNVQFLDRSLRGKSLKFPAKEWGYFQPPKDKLFSEHYRPIVRGKRKYNEDYQLRTSLFGETLLDVKRDHIIDQYKLQANPFRTPASNALISTMYKQKHNHREL